MAQGAASSTRGGRHLTKPVARGGIRKRSPGPARTDRDGDLDMDTGGSRGRASGRGNAGRNATRAHGSLKPEVLEQAVLRGMGSSAASGRRSDRERVNADAALKEARHDRNSLHSERISVKGWHTSRLAAESGAEITDVLLKWIERKASTPKHPVRIRKPHVKGDTLILQVRPQDLDSILRLDTYVFSGATLSIQQLAGPGDTTNEPSATATEIKEKITAMLSRRYDTQNKLLDLSRLGTDPEFANTGMFDSASTQSKFFPAIMKVCQGLFESAQQKREAILSVSLANNNLPNVSTVQDLAYTFPDLRNLDLSNNAFKSLDALQSWRRRFRQLDHLILSGNPLETTQSDYPSEILSWYPSLRTLNNVQVRSDADVVNATKSRFPLPIRGPDFRDSNGIGESFVKQFFPGYDNDRSALAKAFYDSDSCFTLSVNPSALRSLDHQPLAGWDRYIKRSRNLVKINSHQTRVARCYRGIESISEVWASLPRSSHPDLLSATHKWCIECHSVPGVPEANSQSGSGTSGLILIVHGEFVETETTRDKTEARRSFDRTFILGPGSGLGGIRVTNDILTVRAYGGSTAWTPSDASVQAAPPAPAPAPAAVHEPAKIMSTSTTTTARGQPLDDPQKQALALELSKATGMTVQYSVMCLEQVNWNLEAAGQAFQEVKASLPPDAFT